MEGDLTRRLEKLIGYIGHIQIAGVPERHEPDAGELNIVHLFDVLDELGYDGWVGCEYRPAGRTEDGLDWFWRATGG
jgi:hydroxypyruvate isomerase